MTSSRNISDMINKSPCLCIARWTSVDVNFPLKTFSGCYLTHIHSLNDIHDKRGLFNTNWQIQNRLQMLAGKWPADCHYCYLSEKKSEYSERLRMNNSEWAKEFIEKTPASQLLHPSKPLYLEISFSRECNMACRYCSPNISSTIAQDIEKNGEYPINNTAYTLEKDRVIDQEDASIYIQHFFENFDHYLKEVKILRITGGEPVLSKSLYRCLDQLLDHNETTLLEFSLNTNLNYSKQKLDQVLQKLMELKKTNKCKEVLIYTSIDTWGDQAEYARQGLNLETYKRNIEHIITHYPEIKVSIMATYSLYSIPNFKLLLEVIMELRTKTKHKKQLSLDIPYLRNPPHLTCLLVTKEDLNSMYDQYEFISQHTADSAHSFSLVEKNIFQRNLEWLEQFFRYENFEKDQADFYRFTVESDKRKKTDFLTVFPSFVHFFEECHQASKKHHIQDKKVNHLIYPWNPVDELNR